MDVNPYESPRQVGMVRPPLRTSKSRKARWYKHAVVIVVVVATAAFLGPVIYALLF
jgi:hypothetical protein